MDLFPWLYGIYVSLIIQCPTTQLVRYMVYCDYDDHLFMDFWGVTLYFDDILTNKKLDYLQIY